MIKHTGNGGSRLLPWSFLLCGSVALAAPAAEAPPPRPVPSALPLLRLEVKTTISGDQKTPCAVRLTEPVDGATPRTNSWTGVVRFHGATSQAYPKKSFGLTLASPARLLDLRESAHWVLNAAFIDRSLMRHKLSYDLFRSLSVPQGRRFAVASRFIEVQLNGDYQGVYLLMERVDGALMGLRPFHSNDLSHAVIYKAVEHAANFLRPGHGGFEQREPDPLAQPYWQPLDGLNRFVSSASDPGFFDPQQGIAARLDLDNAIDFHLLVLLTSNLDGITKNYIVARDAILPGHPQPQWFFAPWDYDATFGRNWNASPTAATDWLSNHLFDRLLQNQPYRDRFAARWKQLRQQAFSTATVQGLIDDNVRVLGDAAPRNAERWRAAAGYYPDQLSFREDVAQMKHWVGERLSWLDAEIRRRPAPGQAP